MRLWRGITGRRKSAIVQPPLVVEITPYNNIARFSTYQIDFDLFDKNISDTESDDAMSNDDSLFPARRLSIAASSVVAQGPYCPRRPKLGEILADKSPPPWTLSAFTAYCSQNHCLETVEFIKDARRYERMYDEVLVQPERLSTIPNPDSVNELRSLWKRIRDVYMRPNAPREVNLTEEVRQPILAVSSSMFPPSPTILSTAIQKIYELIEGSILLPFLSEVKPFPHSDEHMEVDMIDSPGPSLPRSTDEPLQSPPESSRKTTPSASGHGLLGHRHKSSPSGRLHTNVSYSSTGSAEPVLTDDTGSVSSPGGPDPITPPTTPPMSEAALRENTRSPRARSDAGWKSLGSKFGFRKRSGSNLKAQGATRAGQHSPVNSPGHQSPVKEE